MSEILGRRSALVSGLSLASGLVLGLPREGLAAVKQGLLAGRIPGLSDPDENGWSIFHCVFFTDYNSNDV